MASTLLSRTPGVAGNRRKWTFSTWVKIGLVGGSRVLFASPSDGTNYNELWFSGSAFRFDQWTSGSSAGSLVTNRVFRDPAAWYHIVCVWDSDNATPGDRMKLYVNGVEETSFSLDTNPAQYLDSYVNSTSYPLEVGGMNAGEYFDGVMAHTHFADGQAYAPTVFGETDSTSGIWVPISAPSVTYGTNGFFLKYASGALGTDSSGNSNTMSVSGTMTPTQDNAMNNFCTLNGLDSFLNASTFSNGNTTVAQNGSSNYAPVLSTVGMTSGKWYWEVKPTSGSGGAYHFIGISSTQTTDTTDQELGHFPNDWAYYALSGDIRNNNANTSYGDTYTVDDIIGVALDITNNKLYFSKNGVWQNSGVPTSGATGTGAVSITAAASTPWGAYFTGTSYYGEASVTFETNFGNGYFGTTVAGTETDDAGIGLFKYDVPAGYYTICTTNLGDQS